MGEAAYCSVHNRYLQTNGKCVVCETQEDEVARLTTAIAASEARERGMREALLSAGRCLDLIAGTHGAESAFPRAEAAQELRTLRAALSQSAPAPSTLTPGAAGETCQDCLSATGGVCRAHQEPECTCYEVTHGHQMGCAFYGVKRDTGADILPPAVSLRADAPIPCIVNDCAKPACWYYCEEHGPDVPPAGRTGAAPPTEELTAELEEVAQRQRHAIAESADAKDAHQVTYHRGRHDGVRHAIDIVRALAEKARAQRTHSVFATSAARTWRVYDDPMTEEKARKVAVYLNEHPAVPGTTYEARGFLWHWAVR